MIAATLDAVGGAAAGNGNVDDEDDINFDYRIHLD